jgi:collagenase-like PrtC family protease
VTNEMMGELTLGPILYNWPAASWRDFYLQIADEAPVETVFLGEVICSKRAALFDPFLDEVVTRLQAAGKKLAFSTLAQVASNIDRRLVDRVAGSQDLFIEANDVSALDSVSGKPHALGPYMNVYNEDTLEFLAGKGACSICLPPEMPASGIKAMGRKADELGVDLEVQVYGRIPLALSARCYHARAHDRTKDSCKFICDIDPDGMVLRTLDEQPMLTVNGIQTLSYTCLNLVNELEELTESGVGRFRISPHSSGTIEVLKTFRAVLDGRLDPTEATTRLGDCGPDAPFSNGFYHHQSGYEWHRSQ